MINVIFAAPASAGEGLPGILENASREGLGSLGDYMDQLVKGKPAARARIATGGGMILEAVFGYAAGKAVGLDGPGVSSPRSGAAGSARS